MTDLTDYTDLTSPAGNVVSRDTTLDGPRTLVPVPDVLRVAVGLPTADPHHPGALWSNGGVITTSAG